VSGKAGGFPVKIRFLKSKPVFWKIFSENTQKQGLLYTENSTLNFSGPLEGGETPPSPCMPSIQATLM